MNSRPTWPTIQWIVTGYTLALATVIPVTGWAADRFGTKRLYILAIVLFVGGSALCGAAWSAESLIAFRVLQGLGGGMLMPAGMTILTRAAGPQRVGRVMAIIGVPMLLGPILGPILGGYLVDEVSWRWIFFINLPIGAVALIMSFRILDRDEPQPGERFDVLGLALLVARPRADDLRPRRVGLLRRLRRDRGLGPGAHRRRCSSSASSSTHSARRTR